MVRHTVRYLSGTPADFDADRGGAPRSDQLRPRPPPGVNEQALTGVGFRVPGQIALHDPSATSAARIASPRIGRSDGLRDARLLGEVRRTWVGDN